MVYGNITPFVNGDSNIDFKLRQFSANMGSLRLFNDHGVVLGLSDDMSVPDTTTTPIAWDVEEYQIGGIWTPADAEKLYAPVDGLYYIVLNVEWRTSASGERVMGFEYSSGSTQNDLQAQGSLLGGGNLSGWDLWGMSAGQWLRPNVFHSAGPTIGIRGNGRDRTTVAMWLAGV